MLKRSHQGLLLALLVLGVAYVFAYHASEPFYNNDETRHLMTGVYFRDLLHDMPLRNLRGYTINYYLQHPALGLLVWPPFFYIVEGLMMTLFGTSIIVSKVLVALFGVMACVYLYKLVCLTHDATRAIIAVLFFGLAPLFFELAHYVMLEVPTLALFLAAIYHFLAFLEKERRRDLVLAALFSALAALTRFDAAHLVLLFLIFVFVRKRWKLLWRRDVLVIAALAFLVILPFYALSAYQVGWLHFRSATETVLPSYPGFLSLRRLLFYPSNLRWQIGIVALIPALIGLAFGLTKEGRKSAWPYLAIIITTYVVFTPIGELEPRHSFYWIPAFPFFAADGVALVARLLRMPRLYLPLAATLLAGLMWFTLSRPLPVLRGYEEAASFVAANTTDSPFCLFMGRLNGDFIYQLRHLDPQRKLWVLRADKLLFSGLIADEHKSLADDQQVLDTIYKYDPEFIVVEEPQSADTSDPDPEEQERKESEKRIRDLLSNHPERFSLEKSIPLMSDDPQYKGMTLKVFRNTFRNENPERRLEFNILMLRRSIQTDIP